MFCDLFLHPENFAEVKLTAYVHPWLSSRGLEFSSPGLEDKGFLYDNMSPSDHRPIAKIFIKKWVFSPQRLADTFKDPVALKIIYAQASYLKATGVFQTMS